ncbi:hypothetical protein TSAR_009505 [Trichomalopsis sarcophagae]|uniref:Uncharacterized protein n=1 Tax=Trichomalopsis sarcophagae TaxID=543379 RepID=A0A232EVR4_9HYME|nr:hypothetical protein TSAR_009505 [Trichomalopsis sarcophagae]
MQNSLQHNCRVHMYINTAVPISLKIIITAHEKLSLKQPESYLLRIAKSTRPPTTSISRLSLRRVFHM